jgi:hypothetical protein
MMLTSIQSPHRSYEYTQLVLPDYFAIQSPLPHHNLRNIVKNNLLFLAHHLQRPQCCTVIITYF